MSEDGLRFSDDLRGSYVAVESVDFASPTEATASACWFDAAVVMGPLGPDGNPTIVDDQILSYRYNFVVYLEGGVWRVGEQLDIEHLGSGDACAAA
jgi:hypothetical protein